MARRKSAPVHSAERSAAKDAPAPGRESAGSHAARRPRWLAWLALTAIVACGAWLRIDTALTDPSFRRGDPKGMLRTDPALLYYVTERIVEAGGAPPADLRADPRIEYPETSDWAAMETVGQEFVVAWAKLFLAPQTPLHVVATYAMAITAALTAVGVFGLALELTRSAPWAVFAALLFSISTANYRTIGFILIREDFSLPWFALHLWLLARAVRVRTPLAIALAALPLAVALATWHAMTFVVTLEAACVFAWFLRSGANPLAARHAWILPAILAAVSLCVPVLQSKLFVLSLPMQVSGALLVAGFVAQRRTPSRLAGASIALGAWVLLALLSTAVTRALAGADGGGLADYSHVFAFMKDKILRLGVRPADPGELSYESRLLWQGPFTTGSPVDFLDYPFGALMLLAALGLALPGWLRASGDGRERVLVLFALVAVLMAYLVQRLIVLPGLLTPVVAAVVLARLRPPALGRAVMAIGLIAQGTQFQRLVSRYVIVWYWPPQRIDELAHVIDWVAANVPADAPVAADYVTSPAILAHTRHPVLYQPKYETARSRRRIEAFDRAFFRGPPAELKELLESQGAHWLVVDRQTMLATMRYAAGIADQEPLPPGTPAAAFLSQDERELSNVPGFRLVYRSPPALRLDMFRIYALE